VRQDVESDKSLVICAAIDDSHVIRKKHVTNVPRFSGVLRHRSSKYPTHSNTTTTSGASVCTIKMST
jgi:hypothetical protein